MLKNYEQDVLYALRIAEQMVSDETRQKLVLEALDEYYAARLRDNHLG